MSKFGLFGKFIVKDGERDTLVDILLEAAESMKNLDECEIYLVIPKPNQILYMFMKCGVMKMPASTIALSSSQTNIFMQVHSYMYGSTCLSLP